MTKKLTHEVEPEGISETASQFMPSVYLEISKEQQKVLEIGKQVTITLRGKVKSLSANEQDKGTDRHEVTLELKKVEINDDDNEFSKLAEDD